MVIFLVACWLPSCCSEYCRPRAPCASLCRRIICRSCFAERRIRTRAAAASLRRPEEGCLQRWTQEKDTGNEKKAMDLNPPRGTRDFYPEEMALRNWLFGKMRETAVLHGRGVRCARSQSEDLYIRKAGEDVTQQLYSMEDRSGRRLSLRPEMTPSLARMVLAKANALPMPLKWFSIPQCWRYERMTRGRRREHYQWNLDVWGVDGVTAEVELLSAAVSFMRSLGLTSADVGIKLSTRLVLSELLTSLGVPEDKFASTCVLVDKLDKLPEDEVRKLLLEQGLPEDSTSKLLSTLAITSFEELEAAMGADSPAVAELRQLFELAKAYQLEDWLVLDLSVVRGLAYYTGAVFEGFDRSGELRAIFGGGRYDKLLGTFGGNNLPAAGFGFGDAVIVELLKMKGLLPDFSTSSTDTVLIGMQDESLRPMAMESAMAMRAAGVKTDLVIEAKKMKWLFKHADRTRAPYVVLFAPREVEEGVVRVKCMADGEQEDVKIGELAAHLAAKMGAA